MDGAAKCRAERLSAEPVLWRLTLWPRVRIHSTRRRDLRRCEGIDARGVDAHWSCLQQVHLLPRAPFAPQRRAVAALAAIQRLCGFGPATHSCKLTPVGRAADILQVCVGHKQPGLGHRDARIRAPKFSAIRVSRTYLYPIFFH